VRNVLLDSGPQIALFATDDRHHARFDGRAGSPPSSATVSGSMRRVTAPGEQVHVLAPQSFFVRSRRAHTPAFIERECAGSLSAAVEDAGFRPNLAATLLEWIDDLQALAEDLSVLQVFGIERFTIRE